MHKNCGEKQFEFQNQSEPHVVKKWFWTTFFSNFLIFSSQADNDNGHEGGGVAEDAGGKEENEHQLLTKAGVKSEMLWRLYKFKNLTLSDQYLTIKFQIKSSGFGFLKLEFKFQKQSVLHSGIFLEYSGIVPWGKFTVYTECRN